MTLITLHVADPLAGAITRGIFGTDLMMNTNLEAPLSVVPRSRSIMCGVTLVTLLSGRSKPLLCRCAVGIERIRDQRGTASRASLTRTGSNTVPVPPADQTGRCSRPPGGEARPA